MASSLGALISVSVSRLELSCESSASAPASPDEPEVEEFGSEELGFDELWPDEFWRLDRGDDDRGEDEGGED